MCNRKSAADKLTNNQLQVILTGKFGDGCLYIPKQLKHGNYYYYTNSIQEDIIKFKLQLLDNLVFNKNIYSIINTGYKKNTLYSIRSISSKLITDIACEYWKISLNRLDELGLALWFYDDGSLHKTQLFYNLNTQKFSKEDNLYIINYLYKKWGIKALLTPEHKKSGKTYLYLRIKKYEGAIFISDIMRKYYIPCYDYKLISSETSLK